MLASFASSRRAIHVVWQTSPSLTIGLALATLMQGRTTCRDGPRRQLIVDAV